MARKFNVGRQNEVLLNDKHNHLYEIIKNYSNNSNPNNSQVPLLEESEQNIPKGALWLDDYNSVDNADLKYFDGQGWKKLFNNKFKLVEFLLDETEPQNAINGQLWIDNGVLKYYNNGQFCPIKAISYDTEVVTLYGYEDFAIISPMKNTGDTVIDNFTDTIFSNAPIDEWKTNTLYKVNNAAIYNNHLYICIKEHTSSNDKYITDTTYWKVLNYINQFLLPNTNEDKVFVDGFFVHEKLTEDDSGYTVNNSTCINFPVNDILNKNVSAVHVNPKRIYDIQKKFIKIDKTNPIIEVPEDYTEYYGVNGGVGKLLIKTNNPNTTEYTSIVSNNISCIKLAPSVVNTYDYIYCLHYDFNGSSTVKQSGKLYKKSLKIKDENYIWIGPANANNICVFIQGLYYAPGENTYSYTNDGYIYLKEKLQDNDNLVKQYDVSVLTFPKVYRGIVTDNFDDTYGFRINLPTVPVSKHLIAFIGGIQLQMSGVDVIDDPKGNPLIKYIPSLTKDIYIASKENGDVIDWAIAETDEYTDAGDLKYELWRGATYSIADETGSFPAIVPIYKDKNNPIKDGIYFGENDSPIIFVDGVLAFQQEVEFSSNGLYIYGLQEGQSVVVLGDTKDNNQTEEELSDRVLFEDTISYSTIPTDLCDTTVVYIDNGILCDSSAIYTNTYPTDPGYNGEIKYYINHAEEKWLVYNQYLNKWEEIDSSELIPNTNKTLVSSLNENSRIYMSTKQSVSFLQNIGEKNCTFYSYLYADSIEKRSLSDYCYPDGVNGINNDYWEDETKPKPYLLNYKHTYAPGRNELTVYLNGIRQNLLTPYDINFKDSKNKECITSKVNEFTLAINNGTKEGKAINSQDGYYVYKVKDINNKITTVCKEQQLTADEMQVYIDDNKEITLYSEPNKNRIFYVVEPCESGETTACNRTILTYKDACANNGPYVNNSYNSGDFILSRGTIRVFINGLRQPFGYYQTVKSIKEDPKKVLQAYTINSSNIIEIKDPIIGSLGGNESNTDTPKFKLGQKTLEDGTIENYYYDVIDEIVIETRTDSKIKEITIPIKDNTGEFSEQDGLPSSIFKTKDLILIYINGLAYGNEYKIEDNTIKLTNSAIKAKLGRNNTDIITFEWR